MIIRILFYFVVIFLVLRFLARIILPIFIKSQMKKHGFDESREYAPPEEGKVTLMKNSSETSGKKIDAEDVDFEEIKE